MDTWVRSVLSFALVSPEGWETPPAILPFYLPLPELPFPLLLVHLVGIIHTPPVCVHLLTRLYNLSVELDVLVLLGSDHDRVAEIEVDEDHKLIVARLEESVLDVLVDNVEADQIRSTGGR